MGTIDVQKRVRSRCANKYPKVSADIVERTAVMTDKLFNELQELKMVASNDIVIIVGSCVDVADSIFTDIVQDLRKQGLHKHELKRDVNNAIKAYTGMKTTLREATCDNYSFYLDTLDTIIDSVKDDLTTFKYVVKTVLDRHYNSGTMIIAQFFCALYIMRMAQGQYEETVKLARRDTLKIFSDANIALPGGIDEALRIQFGLFDPTKILVAWDRVADRYKFVPTAILHEIQDDAQFKLCEKIIQRKLTNVKFVENNITKAKELYT